MPLWVWCRCLVGSQHVTRFFPMLLAKQSRAPLYIYIKAHLYWGLAHRSRRFRPKSRCAIYMEYIYIIFGVARCLQIQIYIHIFLFVVFFHIFLRFARTTHENVPRNLITLPERREGNVCLVAAQNAARKRNGASSIWHRASRGGWIRDIKNTRIEEGWRTAGNWWCARHCARSFGTLVWAKKLALYVCAASGALNLGGARWEMRVVEVN